MESALEEYLALSIQASLEAGKAILEVYHADDKGIVYKNDESPLTKADLAAHDIIVDALKKTPYPVLSEEGELLDYEVRKNHEVIWIVDPLDGTKEFVNKNGEFTVNIALIKNQLPILGVVFAPVTKELFFAVENKGAFKMNCSSEDDVNLENAFLKANKLPLKHDSEVYKVVASRSHLNQETEDYIEALKEKYPHIETTSRGSSLKLCMVAEGVANCYPRFAPTMEWDTAAGHAICKFANAKVIDWKTKEEMKYNREELLNNWFVVN